ncbi:tRNA pseudouridine(13) synthase TruD [Salinicola avicenniae]|uniref:tRNA pseudouridine(13) synthase TruD n=1 Tax=Salinicola avicenniae TaxID=2916836 RepID=UPI002072CE83|nr:MULTISPECIES: tRNA pseudouridine(13) synthase TruD [unclassified Salinicola]
MSDETRTWPPAWAFVDGAPAVAGEYRNGAETFQVEEVLGFEPEGAGEHLWVWIEKRGATTPDVARLLARAFDISPRDVGYSGLKDRDAVTRQWFSLALPGREAPEGWQAGLAARGVSCLEARRHPRKLKRGVHRANRFRLRIAGEAPADPATRVRWERLVSQGVPNYFGPQRFGPEGRNVQRARQLFARGWSKRQDPHGLLLSSARSYLFNTVLSARVAEGTWSVPHAGDVLNLEGTASRFLADTVDAALEARAAVGDLHPTGPMWGRGTLESTGDVAAAERNGVAGHPALRDGLEAAGVRQDRRPLRMRLGEAEWLPEPDGACWLTFSLPRGAFATSVLRELFHHPTLA